MERCKVATLNKENEKSMQHIQSNKQITAVTKFDIVKQKPEWAEALALVLDLYSRRQMKREVVCHCGSDDQRKCI